MWLKDCNEALVTLALGLSVMYPQMSPYLAHIWQRKQNVIKDLRQKITFISTVNQFVIDSFANNKLLQSLYDLICCEYFHCEIKLLYYHEISFIPNL